MATGEHRLKQTVSPLCSENMDNIPVGLLWDCSGPACLGSVGCVVLVNLLRTEAWVRAGDTAARNWGTQSWLVRLARPRPRFCTSRKRWKGLYRSPSGVFCECLYHVCTTIHLDAIFSWGLCIYTVRIHRTDGWVKTEQKVWKSQPPTVCLQRTCSKARWLANTSTCDKSTEENVSENSEKTSSCYDGSMSNKASLIPGVSLKANS